MSDAIPFSWHGRIDSPIGVARWYDPATRKTTLCSFFVLAEARAVDDLIQAAHERGRQEGIAAAREAINRAFKGLGT